MVYRKIHIGNDIWEYSIGAGVKIKSNKINVKSEWIRNYEIVGMTKEEYVEKKKIIVKKILL